MFKVKDLIEFLKRQDPEAYLYAYDMDCLDYKKISRNIFKSVKDAKRFERNKWKKFYSELPKNEIKYRVDKEMKDYFKFTEDNDVIIGLKK